MALVLEDGTGLEDANAYADIALAEGFFPALLVELTNWNAASNPQKEDALIAATRYMDLVYTWLGEQANRAVQALEFPRVHIRCDDILQEPDPLPIPIQEAASLLAVLHLDQIAGTNPQGLFGEAIIGTRAVQSIRRKRIKVGSGIEWQTDYAGALITKAGAEKAIPILESLIKCFLEDRGRVGAGRLGRI